MERSTSALKLAMQSCYKRLFVKLCKTVNRRGPRSAKPSSICGCSLTSCFIVSLGAYRSKGSSLPGAFSLHRPCSAAQPQSWTVWMARPKGPVSCLYAPVSQIACAVIKPAPPE